MDFNEAFFVLVVVECLRGDTNLIWLRTNTVTGGANSDDKSGNGGEWEEARAFGEERVGWLFCMGELQISLLTYE